MKTPFTLEAWLKDKSQKVVDEDDRPVRIICTDADGLYPIIGLLDNKIPLPCGKNGRPPYTGGGGGTLFIITPEPELSKFEKGYMRIVHKMKPEEFNDEGLKIAKEEAAELLDLARKQLIEEQYTSDPRKTDLYKLGKAEALKDLPRWQDIRNFAYSWTSEDKTFYNDTLGQLFHKGKKLSIGDLEKLPGFND